MLIINRSTVSLGDVELSVDFMKRGLAPVLCYSLVNVLEPFQFVSEFALADVKLAVNV